VDSSETECPQGHNPSVGVSTEDLDYANFAFGRK
jgi:hypothetical protein